MDQINALQDTSRPPNADETRRRRTIHVVHLSNVYSMMHILFTRDCPLKIEVYYD